MNVNVVKVAVSPMSIQANPMLGETKISFCGCIQRPYMWIFLNT